MLCRLSLSRKHISREGGNLMGLQNVSVFMQVQVEEEILNLQSLKGKTLLYYSGWLKERQCYAVFLFMLFTTTCFGFFYKTVIR